MRVDVDWSYLNSDGFASPMVTPTITMPGGANAANLRAQVAHVTANRNQARKELANERARPPPMANTRNLDRMQQQFEEAQAEIRQLQLQLQRVTANRNAAAARPANTTERNRLQGLLNQAMQNRDQAVAALAARPAAPNAAQAQALQSERNAVNTARAERNAAIRRAEAAEAERNAQRQRANTTETARVQLNQQLQAAQAQEVLQRQAMQSGAQQLANLKAKSKPQQKKLAEDLQKAREDATHHELVAQQTKERADQQVRAATLARERLEGALAGAQRQFAELQESKRQGNTNRAQHIAALQQEIEAMKAAREVNQASLEAAIRDEVSRRLQTHSNEMQAASRVAATLLQQQPPGQVTERQLTEVNRTLQNNAARSATSVANVATTSAQTRRTLANALRDRANRLNNTGNPNAVATARQLENAAQVHERQAIQEENAARETQAAAAEASAAAGRDPLAPENNGILEVTETTKNNTLGVMGAPHAGLAVLTTAARVENSPGGGLNSSSNIFNNAGSQPSPQSQSAFASAPTSPIAAETSMAPEDIEANTQHVVNHTLATGEHSIQEHGSNGELAATAGVASALVEHANTVKNANRNGSNAVAVTPVVTNNGNLTGTAGLLKKIAQETNNKAAATAELEPQAENQIRRNQNIVRQKMPVTAAQDPAGTLIATSNASTEAEIAAHVNTQKALNRIRQVISASANRLDNANIDSELAVFSKLLTGRANEIQNMPYFPMMASITALQENLQSPNSPANRGYTADNLTAWKSMIQGGQSKRPQPNGSTWNFQTPEVQGTPAPLGPFPLTEMPLETPSGLPPFQNALVPVGAPQNATPPDMTPSVTPSALVAALKTVPRQKTGYGAKDNAILTPENYAALAQYNQVYRSNVNNATKKVRLNELSATPNLQYAMGKLVSGGKPKDYKLYNAINKKFKADYADQKFSVEIKDLITRVRKALKTLAAANASQGQQAKAEEIADQVTTSTQQAISNLNKGNVAGTSGNVQVANKQAEELERTVMENPSVQTVHAADVAEAAAQVIPDPQLTEQALATANAAREAAATPGEPSSTIANAMVDGAQQAVGATPPEIRKILANVLKSKHPERWNEAYRNFTNNLDTTLARRAQAAGGGLNTSNINARLGELTMDPRMQNLQKLLWTKKVGKKGGALEIKNERAANENLSKRINVLHSLEGYKSAAQRRWV